MFPTRYGLLFLPGDLTGCSRWDFASLLGSQVISLFFFFFSLINTIEKNGVNKKKSVMLPNNVVWICFAVAQMRSKTCIKSWKYTQIQILIYQQCGIHETYDPKL